MIRQIVIKLRCSAMHRKDNIKDLINSRIDSLISTRTTMKSRILFREEEPTLSSVGIQKIQKVRRPETIEEKGTVSVDLHFLKHA